MVQPGDTVYLRGGTYRYDDAVRDCTSRTDQVEGVRLTTSGTAERPITYAAYPKETPVLDFAGERHTRSPPARLRARPRGGYCGYTARQGLPAGRGRGCACAVTSTASTAPPATSATPLAERAAGRGLVAVFALLTVFGPISMDLYLPVLPALTDELGAATSTAQLTVTSCLLGLALGQLVAGPISDRFGRRRPLLIGVAAFVLTSLACAASQSIEMLVVARFAQGLAGAVGVVIAQAAGRDLYSGPPLLRYYARLTVLAGLAAVVGPVLGGALAAVTDWRGIFVFLALVGAVILVASARVARETLPTAVRTTGGYRRAGRSVRRLFRDRAFVAAVAVSGLVNAAVFAYLSGATFVLQGVYGLSPQGYALAFGLNSAGFMAAGFVSGRVSETWSRGGTVLVGVGLTVLGAAGVLVTAVAVLPLPAMLVSLFTMVAGVAVTSPPATAIALEGYPDIAGTASSVLGMARFGVGGLVAPLVGLAGAQTAVPLGVVALASALAAACALPAIRRR